MRRLHNRFSSIIALPATCALLAFVTLVGTLGCTTPRDRDGTTPTDTIDNPYPNAEPIPPALEDTRDEITVARYMDQQAAELAQIDGATTERVGEAIRLTFSCAVLFDFDSAMLTMRSRERIERVAGVLIKYANTDVRITGHTDNSRVDTYNQTLSERRAMSIRNYFTRMGVASSRIEVAGFGAMRPVAPNDSAEGRARNQRIEIEIVANEALRAREASNEDRD